jgi:hypothetical protein
MPFKNLLEVVQSCDKFPYDESVSDSEYHSTVPFRLGPHVVGRLLPSTVPKLKEYNDRFDTPPFEVKESHITFSSGVDSFEKRTEVVKALFDAWREEKAFVALSGKQSYKFDQCYCCSIIVIPNFMFLFLQTGWRNELYPVYGDLSRQDNIAFVMERAATPIFGISSFGCHLNAFTKEEDGAIKMWIARRSKTKQTWPGYLDNCVCIEKRKLAN